MTRNRRDKEEGSGRRSGDRYRTPCVSTKGKRTKNRGCFSRDIEKETTTRGRIVTTTTRKTAVWGESLKEREKVAEKRYTR